MKSIKLFYASFFGLCLFMVPLYAYCQVSPVSPGDFFNQVLVAIQAMGGLAGLAKVSSVIVLIIASMKVTAINSIFWDKLGAFKAWLAPILGIIAGVLLLHPLTLPGVVAYLFAGGGAVALHELLDSVKAIPGLGSVYVFIIDGIEEFLNPGLQSKNPEVK